MLLLYVRLDIAWQTGACVHKSTHINGVVLLPVAKKKHATANPTAPPQPTGVAFILNLSGIYACIRQSHVVRKNIKKI